MSKSRRRIDFNDDDRAIERLPIRLVIAPVVASLGIMMNMLSGVGTLAETEVDVEIEPTTIDADEQETVVLTVVGEDSNEVEDATVIVSSGSDRRTEDAETGEEGTAEIDLEPELNQGQGTGTLEDDIHPPTSTDYVGEQGNNEISVTES